MKKNEKGITLIALVITIIVLLILAGVSISMALGENGILTRSENAKESYEYATAKEIIELKVANLDMERIIEGTDVSELQYLANGLHPNADSEIEYVDVATRIASTSNILIGDSISSIFVKLKAYKYEFEIDRTGKIVGAIDTETKKPVEEDSTEAENTIWITEEENGELTIIGAYVENIGFGTENNYVSFGINTLVFPSTINGKPVKKVNLAKVIYEDIEYTDFRLEYSDLLNIVVEEGIEEFIVDAGIDVTTVSLPSTLKTTGTRTIYCDTLVFPNGKNSELIIYNIKSNKILVEGTEIEKLLSGISLGDLSYHTRLSVGETLDLSEYLQISPENITLDEVEVIWKSDDEEVVKVDNNGLVTAISTGSWVMIRVDVSDGYSSDYDYCYITVE